VPSPVSVEGATPGHRVDRVAVAASALAVGVALALPFAEFKPNRIASGEQLSLLESSGPWAWVVLALLVAGLLAAIAPPTWRRAILAPLGAAAFGAVLFAAGYAASTLAPDPEAAARVSLGAGAWALLALTGALWFQGWQHGTRVARVASLVGGLVLGAAAFAVGGLQDTSLAREYQARADMFWPLVAGHVTLALSSVAIATLIGIPAGVVAARSRRVRGIVVPAVGLVQTVPSLALLGLLIAPLAALGLPAIGALPALIALTLYALLPIVRNTYLGISAVDEASLDAGRGMGMSSRQLMLRVEFPLAMPLILEGLRAALVLIVGITAVMAIGGARTLGILVFEGWGVQAADLTLLGAVPMVILAVFADRGMRALERIAVSPGIRERA
jgi:osmoprotectant transport system permease protein